MVEKYMVDPDKRKQAIRYFQEAAGGTLCWNEVKEFLRTAECTIDEHGNPHFVSTVGNIQELRLPRVIDLTMHPFRNLKFIERYDPCCDRDLNCFLRHQEGILIYGAPALERGSKKVFAIAIR